MGKISCFSILLKKTDLPANLLKRIERKLFQKKFDQKPLITFEL